MEKKTKIIFTSIICGLIALAVALFCVKSCTDEKIVELEQQINYLEEEFIPMKFEIGKYSDSDIELKVVLYNLKGKKVGSKNIELKGQEINFDFRVVNFSNKNFLFFPCGLYSDQMAMIDSVKVFDKYDKKGFPTIYEGLDSLLDTEEEPLSDKSKEAINKKLSSYFDMIKNNKNDLGTESYGIAVHDIKTISQFKKGFVYDIVCHPHTGGIEIVME